MVDLGIRSLTVQQVNRSLTFTIHGYHIYIYTHIIYIYIYIYILIINGSLMSAYVGDPESRSFLKFSRDWRPRYTWLSLAVASSSLVPFFQSRNWNWRRYFPWRLLPRSFNEAMNVFQIRVPTCLDQGPCHAQSQDQTAGEPNLQRPHHEQTGALENVSLG